MTDAALPTLDRRRAGVLLHPTSLPGGGDNGTLGEHAFRFVDFLQTAGFTVWQTLPLVPVNADLSPYSGLSAHAMNESLIDTQRLCSELSITSGGDDAASACLEFMEASPGHAFNTEFAEFLVGERHWLEDYALFSVLRTRFYGKAWWDWPEPYRDRDSAALALLAQEETRALQLARLRQFLVTRQWRHLKAYANDRGIRILGDIPLFVAENSVDVWACQRCFRLDESGRPAVVAGVPPDYFSATGQRWGNPHYNWEYQQDTGFAWWLARFESQLKQCDLLRIDHFRGLEASWVIDAAEETAINGYWQPVPGAELLQACEQKLARLPFVAEDLGTITAEVHALRERFGLPGMAILQFAFGGGDDNPYLPDNQQQNSVVYTGTHDNNTTQGWFDQASEQERVHALAVLQCDAANIVESMIDSVLSSVADLAVVPMQDLLCLDGLHRMNVPGTEGDGNWRWRFDWRMVPDELSAQYRTRLEHVGRA